MSLLRLLPLAALMFCACDETEPNRVSQNTHPKPTAASSSDEQAKADARIQELKVEINYHKDVISDLEAAVLMERAKVEDDPDYDQSFLQETLAEQEHQRELIERAEKKIEELAGSGQ